LGIYQYENNKKGVLGVMYHSHCYAPEVSLKIFMALREKSSRKGAKAQSKSLHLK